MPRNSKKNSERKNNFNKKSELSNFEIIQFLQYEYDWQKQRRSDLVDKAKLFLCWNAAVFAFAIVFTNVENIICILKHCTLCIIYVCTIFLTILLVLSIIILAVSSCGFFQCLGVGEINCFEVEKYIDGEFEVNKILKDYRDIIVDYDNNIKTTSKKVEFNIVLMVIGVASMLIIEMLLRILVAV